MNASEQTLLRIERAIRKTAEKFPANEEASVMTDIHVRVTQETGELMTFDDDDKELTRCVVEEWIDNKDDDFYEAITPIIRRCLSAQKQLVDAMSILKPYAFVLEDDEHETKAELYVVDDEVAILDQELLPGLDDDLDKFLDDLLKE
ncbi:MAG: hypothetical protein II949_10670 [Prevotella sp.]|jgi:hypothetical protein|nr:hypothetical protein [Prevotella sp.]